MLGCWSRRRIAICAACAAAILAGAGYVVWHRPVAMAQTSAVPPSSPPVPVETALARRLNVPVYLSGLGTVSAFNAVTIKSRVDGELQKVAYTEGMDVKAGDVLAQIDPRPYEATLAQAQATKAKDEAQLANARLDLDRFVNLKEFASRQSVDTQKALIAQFEAQVQVDQAAIDSAATELGYTTITSPLTGRIGIRLVDQGNIVHASDPQGLVMITQIHPISVIFTLPDDQLPAIAAQMAGAGPLKVLAKSRVDQRTIATGTLSVIDNQIDQSTGTIRLKARFDNKDNALWPGQFVNVQLLLKTEPNVVTVPSTAVQRGPDGMFAYVVAPDTTVAVRPISVGQVDDGTAVIEHGLNAGEQVVNAGQYRLRPGARIQVREAENRGGH